MKTLRWVLWPSFLVAAATEFAFFAVIDPQDLRFFGHAHELSVMTIYSVGFFCFWAIAMVSSFMTLFLQGHGRSLI